MSLTFALQHSLISARFLTTLGHLIAILVLCSTIENNVIISLPDYYTSKERDEAMDSAWAALIISFICFAFDFSGIFLGTSLFYRSANTIQIFFHFVGTLFLCWLITDNWSSKALWPIVISCNLPPSIYEVFIILSKYFFKIWV